MRLLEFLRDPVWGEKEAKSSAADHEPTPATATATIQVGNETGTITVGGDAGGGDGGDAGKGGDGGGSTGLSDLVLKAVTAIATAVGVTGAVAVVGASLYWIRFDQVGLPATQAVNALPNTELVVQGAQEVIVFVLVALAAVLAIGLGDPKGTIKGGTLLLLGLLAVGGGIYAITTALHFWSVVLLFVLAFLLAAGCVRVGRSTGQRFWPLAVSVFFAAIIFSATITYLVTKQQKFVQAVAILRVPDDKGLTGIYVTATDKTIFFGHLGPMQSGLYEVDRSPKLTYAVGPLESKPDAETRARDMLDRMIEQSKRLPKVPKPKPGKGGKKK